MMRGSSLSPFSDSFLLTYMGLLIGYRRGSSADTNQDRTRIVAPTFIIQENGPVNNNESAAPQLHCLFAPRYQGKATAPPTVAHARHRGARIRRDGSCHS